ncbi:3-hydroxyacyl-ACP dehydratase FabZ [Tropicibacter sp. R15_0]|uniref:3-hydroxyacyl-ACP dehydratase FabZ n=1 Tax=Tropicibacter sp. R15_0 TaxID=2821101 RepID=UPI001ADD5560|nr:3-hydroxyacyl-ACP dehydratase FabZ [Tropicibacter sp. R15_0]MBO9463665.1 3-hydroxyacyl-ACP dehydratase FabZ [Tropicibacter sp. R15_0]
MKDMATTSYDIQAIMARLPHRYPLLMIDKVDESGPGYAVAVKNVSINEPYFQGHFPDYPIMPGALITEAALQASAFMGPTGDETGDAPDASNTRFFCVGFNMKFSGTVQPGDQLRIEVRLVKRMGQMTKVKARISTENGQVASGDMNLATAPKED